MTETDELISVPLAYYNKMIVALAAAADSLAAAADRIERLEVALRQIDNDAQCDWCADIARAALSTTPADDAQKSPPNPGGRGGPSHRNRPPVPAGRRTPEPLTAGSPPKLNSSPRNETSPVDRHAPIGTDGNFSVVIGRRPPDHGDTFLIWPLDHGAVRDIIPPSLPRLRVLQIDPISIPADIPFGFRVLRIASIATHGP